MGPHPRRAHPLDLNPDNPGDEEDVGPESPIEGGIMLVLLLLTIYFYYLQQSYLDDLD